MKHSRTAKIIIGLCMFLVFFFSMLILYRTMRPSPGLPYEQLTMEQAVKYMQFESDFLVADAGSREDYEAAHIPGAVNIPPEELVGSALLLFSDPEQMIYVYAASQAVGREAAMKLCTLGYTNITWIEGTTEDYYAALSGLETEGWFR